MNTFKKLFSVTAILALLTTTFAPALNNVEASFSTELNGAYEFAAENGITSASDITVANMYGSLTRVAMAKMMANFSVDVLGNEADTDMECNFPDVSSALDAQYDMGVTNACQLSLMGVGVDNFNPYGLVTRAEFGTVLSRALYGDDYNGADPYYADHLDALQDAGIMSNISNPMMLEVRGYVMLMMERASDDADVTEGCSAEELLACITADDYDDCIADCSGEEEDEDPDYELNGDLTVDLDNSTPDSMKLPKLANGVEVAVFEVEADGSDVDLFTATFELVGMGASSAVEDIALFTEDGRVSKAKSFNSDDIAVVTFSPALTIKAGQKVELKAVISTKDGTAGDEFAITLTDMDTTAEDLDANYPIVAETMELGSVDATPVTVAMDGQVSTLKVGEEEAEVLKFKVTNNTLTKEDVELSSITLKENGSIDEEDEMSNFVLWFDGEEVATVKNADGKYVTFNLDDTVLIEEGKTEKFVVTADIDGGAAKTVQLFIDKKLDVMLTASKYGFVSITNTVVVGAGGGDSNAINVEAGELSIVTTEPEMTEVRKDKDNLVIGELKFVANAGKDLELDDFTVVLTIDTVPTAGDDDLSNIFENVELYNASAGGIYDLACTENNSNGAAEVNDTLTCVDTDMDISLRDGSTTFEIRLDTQNVTTAAAGLKFHASVNVASDVKVYETEDDQRVTDVTPSSISYKGITIQDSTAVLTPLTLSAAKSAVIGSTDVVIHKFEIEAGDSSDIEIDEIKVTGTTTDYTTATPRVLVGADDTDNTRINSFKLYEGEVDSSNLLDTVAGSQIASDVATFNGFKVDVEKGEKKVFYVTLDVINDVNQANDDITVSVTSVDADDSDNDDISVTINAAGASTRTLTIKGVGELVVVTDNTDTETDKSKNILGGLESDFVASYEFTATNEGVLIKDLEIENTAGTLTNAVSEVVIYANDKTTELGRESVSANIVKFDNINMTITEGNENVYVKVITSKIGKDEAGTQTADLVLKLSVTDAEGEDSSKVVSGIDHDVAGGVQAQTVASNSFSVLPVMISSLAFVDSFGGFNVATTLNNGDNNVAIIAVTTDANANSDTNGGELKAALSDITVRISKLAGADATDSTTLGTLSIERINGNDANGVSVLIAAHTLDLVATANEDISFDVSTLTSDDSIIENATTTYFLVKVGATKATNADIEDYVKVEFVDLANVANGITYAADDNGIAGYANITDLRMGTTKLDGTQING